ncbi:MAG: hypothetical protein KJS97_00295 [Alphaproteobacteria bacterium]|nr:hypothetical protein [Alphaproteobacteria bacterium]
MAIVRPALAWTAAALTGAAAGATLSVGLVMAFGYVEWPFLGWVWLVLAGVGAVLALVGGAVLVPLATAAARHLSPPRPAADMLFAAVTAFAILMGVRALIFARARDPVGLPDPGVILLVPLLAGALAGFVYWRLAQRR